MADTYDGAAEAEDDLEADADGDEAGATPTTPLRALRRYCLWCCNGSANEVRLCTAKACPLWTFRLGHRPTPEDMAAVADVKLYRSSAQRPVASSRKTAVPR